MSLTWIEKTMKFWKSESEPVTEELYLRERVVELEVAEDRLCTLLMREDGTFKNDVFLQNSLISVIKEQKSVRKRLSEVTREREWKKVRQ